MEQSDVSKYLWIEDVIAATTITFLALDFDDMIDPKEDYYKDDVIESLWIEDMERATTISFPIPEHFDLVEQYYDMDAIMDHFPSANALAMEQSDVSKYLWIEDMEATTTIPFPDPDFDNMIDSKKDYYKENFMDCLWE